MKKEHLNRKLSLNKKNISQLDVNSMKNIKGGTYVLYDCDPKPVIEEPAATTECSDGCHSRTCTVA